MSDRQVRPGALWCLLHNLDGSYSVVLLDWVEERRGEA